MASGNWLNSDGLYLKYGTSKATPNIAGDFLSYGETREISFRIADMSTLTSSAVILSDVTFVPTGCIIESVEVVADTACTSSGSGTLNVGLMKVDRTTTISDTALVSALALTAIDGLGEKTIMTFGSTSAGTVVGTTIGADVGYITAKYGTAAFQLGAVTVRIKYRNQTTITQ